jgi:two-component system NarL family sensor kinase
VELHDSVGQSLSAVKYTLERGVEMLRQPQLGDPAAALQLAVQRIQETAESIRSISTHLRPRILDDLGAASAAQWFCRHFAETYPALAVVVDVTVRDRQVPDRLATVVYRGLQELLNNVAKHAKARRALIKLSLADRNLLLQVQDDGVGLESATAESRRRGSGLRNLRERAQMTGGQFTVSRAPGRGTLAQLSWRLAGSDWRAVSEGKPARGRLRRPPRKRSRRNSLPLAASR